MSRIQAGVLQPPSVPPVPLVLETNGILNGSQVLLNLKQSGIITLTDDGVGGVTISAPSPVLNFLPLTGGTLTGDLLFSLDNAHDIGASGATRPRTGYFATSVITERVQVNNRLITPAIVPVTDAVGSLVIAAAGGAILVNIDTLNKAIAFGAAAASSRYTFQIDPSLSGRPIAMGIVKAGAADFQCGLEFGTASTKGNAGGIYWRTGTTPTRVEFTSFSGGSPLAFSNGSIGLYVDIDTNKARIGIGGLGPTGTTAIASTLHVKDLNNNITQILVDAGSAQSTNNLQAWRSNTGSVLASIGSAGAVDTVIGYRVSGAATSGNVLRGDGTNFVSAKLNFSDLTGPSYGNMNSYHIGQTVTVASSGVFYPITSGMSTGLVNGFTFQSSQQLRCDVAGVYSVQWAVCLESAAPNQELMASIMLNSAVITAMANHGGRAATSGHAPIAGGGIVTLAVNDILQLCVDNESSATDIVIEHAMLTLVRIG